LDIEVDGRRVFAATGGRPFDAGQPCVIFIHGAGMDHTVWQLQTRYFAYHGHSVLAVDLPGHGRSEGPLKTSIGDMAEWVLGLMDAVGVAAAALVGHSMGALTALDVAARAPDRASALALLGVAKRMPVHPDLLAAAQKDDHLALDLITSWAFGRRAHIGGHKAPGAWMTGGGLRLLERSASGVVANDLAACDEAGDVTPLAAAVTCPTLFVLADMDIMTPAKAAQPLIEGIADARSVVLEGCGHMMMVEQPDQTLDALRQVI